MKWFKYIVFFSVILCVSCKNEVYKGNKVYRLVLTNQYQHDAWGLLKTDSVDFWRYPSFSRSVDGLAMVASDVSKEFELKLNELGIVVDVYIEDVYEFLKKKDTHDIVQSKTRAPRNFGYDGYYRYDDILEHITNISSTNPNIIQINEHGYTDGSNRFTSLYISNNASSFKPIIMIEAGINPRDWITIPAALNVAERLLVNNGYLESFDWLIVPVANPDGYEYTHTDQRLWTKSTSTNSHLGFICPGVNLNRNFDVSWQTADSSSSPCSHIYSGTGPGSEMETQILANLLEQHKGRILAYISLQNNGGGLITFPWRYEKAASGMFRQHYALGEVLRTGLNEQYVIDLGSESMSDRISGTSSDYAQRNSVLYSIVFDILQGENGVLIEDILITSLIEDVWNAVTIVADHLV